MKRAVVICPGRGTYNKAELGYLARHFPDGQMLSGFDAQREAMGQETVSALDSTERFSLAKHTRGDNASALIFASSLGDFLSMNNEKVEIVAVTGNSMGWYTTLACAGATSAADGFRIANTMGTLMQDNLTGGQTVYPFIDENWLVDDARRAEIDALIHEINARPYAQLMTSIELGGMLVLAGDGAGLKAFEQAVEPVQDRFPMRLGNHAAFHTPLVEHVSELGLEALPTSLFQNPSLPMIDGRGHIWWPHACAMEELRDYTLRTQVIETYDFTHAVRIAAREFAPDLFIVAGPGNTLGGAVAQSLIMADWTGLESKAAFVERQESAEPILASMGLEAQRGMVT
ncbi:ACP S-malonyltransferase [Altererythrobacter lutimaris]|uniref:ACP S-malonyltransferase n=1 Tax=Altererythrobacter lutimaris TaxID=2743979 RepID=UPI001C3C2AE9|nr:ACP S-malonyltransferase [Altererythrobacter lutimaris]